MSEAMKGLGVGRIVHFTYPDLLSNKINGEYPLICHAAIITRVVDAERGVVNLQYFDDNSRHAQRSVPFNEEHKEGSWHWPEQV